MLNKEIYLTEEEQIQLKEIVRKGVHNAHVIILAEKSIQNQPLVKIVV